METHLFFICITSLCLLRGFNAADKKDKDEGPLPAETHTSRHTLEEPLDEIKDTPRKKRMRAYMTKHATQISIAISMIPLSLVLGYCLRLGGGPISTVYKEIKTVNTALLPDNQGSMVLHQHNDSYDLDEENKHIKKSRHRTRYSQKMDPIHNG